MRGEFVKEAACEETSLAALASFGGELAPPRLDLLLPAEDPVTQAGQGLADLILVGEV